MKELTSADITHVGGAGFLAPTFNISANGTDTYGFGAAVDGISKSLEKGFEFVASPLMVAGGQVFGAILKKVFGV